MFLGDNHWIFWTFTFKLILLTFKLILLLWNKYSKKLVKETEDLFLIESTMTENPTFPYNTALSKALSNVRRNRTRRTKWIYHK